MLCVHTDRDKEACLGDFGENPEHRAVPPNERPLAAERSLGAMTRVLACDRGRRRAQGLRLADQIDPPE